MKKPINRKVLKYPPKVTLVISHEPPPPKASNLRRKIAKTTSSQTDDLFYKAKRLGFIIKIIPVIMLGIVFKLCLQLLIYLQDSITIIIVFIGIAAAFVGITVKTTDLIQKLTHLIDNISLKLLLNKKQYASFRFSELKKEYLNYSNNKQKNTQLIIFLIVISALVAVMFIPLVFSFYQKPQTGGNGGGDSGSDGTTTEPNTYTTAPETTITTETITTPYTTSNTISNTTTLTTLMSPKEGGIVSPTKPTKDAVASTAVTTTETTVQETTTTDYFIFEDNYSYTYLSDLGNGETTLETITGTAIKGFNSLPDENLLIIPDQVTIIDDSAFYGCKIQSLILSNSVQVIGNDAFRDCAELSEITLSPNLRYIGDEAFSIQNYEKERFIYLYADITDFLTQIRFGTNPFGDLTKSNNHIFDSSDRTTDLTKDFLEYLTDQASN